MAKVGTRAVGVAYIARDLCLVSKRFASMETANAWLERVGAKDRVFYDCVMTERGWTDDGDHYDAVKAMTTRAWAHLGEGR